MKHFLESAKHNSIIVVLNPNRAQILQDILQLEAIYKHTCTNLNNRNK